MRLDIFCHIVDNYGDAGVCWRLTRRLAQSLTTGKYDSIRLFCDELTLLNFLAGGDAQSFAQHHGFEIHPWSKAADQAKQSCPDAVIETFSCDIPNAYLDVLRSNPHCLRVNVEYLSAEPWIDSHHLMSSPGTTPPRHFFFPGFTKTSGRILKGLPTPTSIPPRALQNSWQYRRKDAISMSLFCYDTPKVRTLLNTLQTKSDLIDVWVCYGQAQNSVSTFLNTPFSPGSVIDHHALRFIGLPFVSQDDYDFLLTQSDLNIVRGEDSFVRACWAAKPFIWDIYPQDDDAHLLKLAAFLQRYAENIAPDERELLDEFMAFNLTKLSSNALEKLTFCAKKWRSHLDELTADGDLAEKLLDFLRKRLKSVKI